MARFRTEVSLPKVTHQLSYRKPFLMIGSCFSENIGSRLRELCFPILVNPFGVLYNPESIASSLENLIDSKIFDESDLFFHNHLWSSFSLHGSFSSTNKAELLDHANQMVAEGHQNLLQASHLFITFGTAWVYADKESSMVVANCHKIPDKNFNRFRLEVDQIVERWKNIIGKLTDLNPNLHIVLTVSPIRHLKDGAHQNQVSKSTLIVACAKLAEHFGDDRISYFPSYELVMDELRDYRFYATDMIHLSDTAISFIAEKFDQLFIDRESRELASRIDKILRGVQHRPLREDDPAYHKFIDNLEVELSKIKTASPNIKLNPLTNAISAKRDDKNF